MSPVRVLRIKWTTSAGLLAPSTSVLENYSKRAQLTRQ
jgi:hypothetical protein